MTDHEARDGAQETIEHLQAAARELIAAARAALDAAERLVDDPQTVNTVAGAAGKLSDLFRMVNPNPSRRPSATDDHETWDDDHDSGFEDDGPTVERITVR